MKYAKYDKLAKKKANDRQRAELYLEAKSIHEYLVSKEMHGIYSKWFDKYVVYWLYKEHFHKSSAIIAGITLLLSIAIEIPIFTLFAYSLLIWIVPFCMGVVGSLFEFAFYMMAESVSKTRLVKLGIDRNFYIDEDSRSYMTFGGIDDILSKA